MAKAKPRVRGDRDYLFRRNGVYYVKFQYPEPVRKALEEFDGTKLPREKSWSLNTTVERDARMAIKDDIARHLDILALAQVIRSKTPDAVVRIVWDHEPGTDEVLEDGTHVMADEHLVITRRPGQPFERRDNHKRYEIEFADGLEHRDEEDGGKLKVGRFRDGIRKALRHEMIEGVTRAEAIQKADDKALDDYLATLAKGSQAGPKTAFRKFKEHVHHRSITQSTRDDVQKFIKEEMDLKAKGNPGRKNAGFVTVSNYVKFLSAMVNLSMEDAGSPYSENIFAGHSWKRWKNGYVAEEGEPFTEEERRIIRENPQRFKGKEHFQLLALHIATSARPEALHSIERIEIVHEDEYDDDANLVARHTIPSLYIERDKDPIYGPRKLPIPDSIRNFKWIDGTPLLPDEFKGTLFSTRLKKLRDEINATLKELGIERTMYSGRHRARDRLGDKCPDRIRRYIMGHRRSKDPHERYGSDQRMYNVLPWIRIIGF